ncbi:protein ACCELERATED CELL DEATH 6-like [Syzygium oleosum]|uniref:protein ACCELERATED CELL DEATH 6-like n=1 Tax=Syzygium oleosum TaxID=219896 RepID=UPI0024B95819|nr:protein ACCELERATED CELL DEATH 6-like [Syzygium oleosum]
MDPDSVRITIEDNEIWEQRKTRLKALEPGNEPHTQVEFSYLTKKKRVELNCRVYPLLQAATKKGDVDEFIEALEKYSAEERVSLSDIIGIQGPSGNSLLHVAAGIENTDILRALLEVIHDKQLATVCNYQKDTPLHVAARAGRIHTAKLLHGCGMIVAMVNDAGNTALHEAVKNGHYDLTSMLLSERPSLVYKKNKESKSPLYLAVEMGDLMILRLLMAAMQEHELLPSLMEGMSPVHGAVIYRRIVLLKEMLRRQKELAYLRDAGDRTPLHFAAYANYVSGVKFLVKEFSWSAFEGDDQGYLPIHVACKMGHLETIKELLQHWPNPEELVNFEGQNILHVAAKYGMASVVKYILGDPELEKLVNAKDWEGNTPLHVATLHWQPEVLFSLTHNNKVNLELKNNSNLTALDIVDEQLKTVDAPLRKSLTRIILVSAGAPISKDKAICQPEGLVRGEDPEPPRLDRLEKASDARMLAATLIAAMTFAAGLSVPGGYNGSEPDARIATLLNKPMYDVFVICNTVAMYSSIIAVVILLWSQINDWHAMHRALGMAELLLLIALATMSVAFMTGVYVTISKRTCIAVVAMIVGMTALFIISSLYIAMFFPLGYSSPLIRPFTNCIIRAGVLISRSGTKGRADNKPGLPEDALRSSGLVFTEKAEETTMMKSRDPEQDFESRTRWRKRRKRGLKN